MILVELYSKDDCHLCDDAKSVLEKVREQIPFTLREIKIIEGDSHFDEYRELVPVVHINKVLVFKYRINEGMLKFRLLQVSKELEHPEGELPYHDDGDGKS